MTPLHVAAKSARFKVVECLVDEGANISTTDNDEVSICVYTEMLKVSQFLEENIYFHYML